MKNHDRVDVPWWWWLLMWAVLMSLMALAVLAEPEPSPTTGHKASVLSTAPVTLDLYVRRLTMPVGSRLSITFEATASGIDVIDPDDMPSVPPDGPVFWPALPDPEED